MTLPPFALLAQDDDDVYLTTTSEVTFFSGLSLYVKMVILYAGAHHLYRLWSNSNFSKQVQQQGSWSNNCLNNNGTHTQLPLYFFYYSQQSQLVLELNRSKCLSLYSSIGTQIIKQNSCTVAQIQSGQNKKSYLYFFSLDNLFLKIG